jgi:hypothetical protein
MGRIFNLYMMVESSDMPWDLLLQEGLWAVAVDIPMVADLKLGHPNPLEKDFQ